MMYFVVFYKAINKLPSNRPPEPLAQGAGA
jgi:hypothetical protein